LQSVETLDRIGGQEFPGLLGEIKKDRAGFDDGVGLSRGTVRIHDRRHFVQRIDLAEFRAELVAFPHVHDLGIVGQLAFLEHDENLLRVRAGQRVEVDHRGVSCEGPADCGGSL
jgi:hypothetical protein